MPPVPSFKKKKNTLSGVFFCVLHMEARGVEPLSEGNATKVSTGVVTVLMSPEYRPVTGYTLGQPDYLLQLTAGGDETAYSTIC